MMTLHTSHLPPTIQHHTLKLLLARCLAASFRPSLRPSLPPTLEFSCTHTHPDTHSASTTAIPAAGKGSSRASAHLRAIGGLRTLRSALGAVHPPEPLLLNSLHAIEAAASADHAACAELIDLGVAPIASLLKGGTKPVSLAAASLLELLCTRADGETARMIRVEVEKADGLAALVAQLERGTEKAARAALLIDARVQVPLPFLPSPPLRIRTRTRT